MTVEIVKGQIKQFLSNDKPGVIAICGDWGIGKTFLWNKLLQEAKAEKITLNQYSYVSLFGINSLQEFKLSLFTQVVNRSEIGNIPSIATFKANIETMWYSSGEVTFLDWFKAKSDCASGFETKFVLR